MELRYRVQIPFKAYERGQDIPAEEVTKDDLQFNRIVAYHYSAPPPQQDTQETPPPKTLVAASKRRPQTTDSGE